MQIDKKLSEKLTLYYIEDNKTEYDENDEEKVVVYQLWLGFCGQDGFTCYVSSSDLDKKSARYLSCEGPSELFESFSEAMEENHWEEVVKQCKKFDKWYSDFYSQ